jgi:hypothetical protein
MNIPPGTVVPIINICKRVNLWGKRYQRYVFSSGNARQRILYKPDPERYLRKIQGLSILILGMIPEKKLCKFRNKN